MSRNGLDRHQCSGQYSLSTSISVFMGGSPVAGETESSKEFIVNDYIQVLRLGPDELRCYRA